MIFNLKGLGSVHDGLVDLICDEGTLTLVPLSVQKYANVDGVIYCWAGFKLNKSQWVFRELEPPSMWKSFRLSTASVGAVASTGQSTVIRSHLSLMVLLLAMLPTGSMGGRVFLFLKHLRSTQ